MKQFMDENFMLNNETAVRLYHDFAAGMPIFDYHCHLNPQEIYEDIPFDNITQLFLGGDHYKWRYMRSCGIDEAYITGSMPDQEKFRAFCRALQYGIGNRCITGPIWSSGTISALTPLCGRIPPGRHLGGGQCQNQGDVHESGVTDQPVQCGRGLYHG